MFIKYDFFFFSEKRWGKPEHTQLLKMKPCLIHQISNIIGIYYCCPYLSKTSNCE